MRRTALIIVALLAGCSSGGGDGGSSISASDGEKLVLQREDLGAGFIKFDEGEQSQTDLAPPRDDPTRFDRVNGWKSRFQRRGTPSTRGPLVVESRADLFDDADGAQDDFGLYEEALDQMASGARGKPLTAPKIGDETHAIGFEQGAGAARVGYYAVAWRHDNVTGYVLVNGFARGTRLADAVDLARKQEARIAAAAG